MTDKEKLQGNMLSMLFQEQQKIMGQVADTARFPGSFAPSVLKRVLIAMSIINLADAMVSVAMEQQMKKQ